MRVQYNFEEMRDLANARITELLESLGFKDLLNRYGYIQAACLHDGADNKTAFSYHVDMKIWKCFSHGCDDIWGHSIIGLIRFALDRMGRPSGVDDAVKYLMDFFGEDFKKVTLEDEEILLKSFKNKKKNGKNEDIYEETVLSRLKPNDYLIKRGFKNETVVKFGIGYCDNQYKKFFNRIVIPIRDIDGNIVGFTARWAGDHKKDEMLKWIHSGGFQKSNHLFNLHEALKYIRESGEVILTEGPLEIIKLYECGIFNAVAIFGTSVSYIQKSIILSNCSSVILAFDSDAAGEVATSSIASSLKGYLDVYRINLPINKDIDDLPNEEIVELLKKKERL